MKGLEYKGECKIVVCGLDAIYRNTVCFLKNLNWLLTWEKNTCIIGKHLLIY